MNAEEMEFLLISRIFFSLVLVASGAVVAEGVRADGRDETERWVPSLALTSGLLVQGGTGAAAATNVQSYSYAPYEGDLDEPYDPTKPGCEVSGSPQVPRCPFLLNAPPQPDISDSSSLLAPTVGADLELMTPGWTSMIGRPRFFAHAGIDVSFGFDYDLAKSGVPGEMDPPTDETNVTLAAVSGQGSKVTASIGQIAGRAGFGVAFTSEVWGRRLRIKPSVEWMWSSVEVSGLMNRAYSITAPAWQETGGGFSEFYLLSLEGKSEKNFHSLGPGLEFELDTVRMGPIVVALGISGAAYRVLGSRTVSFSSTQNISNAFTPSPVPSGPTPDFNCTDPANPSPQLPPFCFPAYVYLEKGPAGVFDGPVTATWSYEQDAWAYRGGIAVRFRYAPE